MQSTCASITLTVGSLYSTAGKRDGLTNMIFSKVRQMWFSQTSAGYFLVLFCEYGGLFCESIGLFCQFPVDGWLLVLNSWQMWCSQTSGKYDVLKSLKSQRGCHFLGLFCEWRSLLRICRALLRIRRALVGREPTFENFSAYICANEPFIFAKEPQKMKRSFAHMYEEHIEGASRLLRISADVWDKLSKVRSWVVVQWVDKSLKMSCHISMSSLSHTNELSIVIGQHKLTRTHTLTHKKKSGLELLCDSRQRIDMWHDLYMNTS